MSAPHGSLRARRRRGQQPEDVAGNVECCSFCETAFRPAPRPGRRVSGLPKRRGCSPRGGGAAGPSTRGEKAVHEECCKRAFAIPTACLSQRCHPDTHTQVEHDVRVLRNRIAELEADNARLLQSGASGSGDTPRANGWDGVFSVREAETAHTCGGGLASPLRANQPAAAVLAAAAAAASARHSMASTVASAGGDIPASAAGAHTHLALEPLPQGAAGLQWAQQQHQQHGAPQLQPPSATWRRQGDAAGGLAVAAFPPSLRDDFIVAAHRLKVAQRTNAAWFLWACFTSWRREARARAQSDTRAALLLRRVLRRSAATAFRAWRDAAGQHSHRSAASDDAERGRHNSQQQHQLAELPSDMERLLRACPPGVKSAFEQQLGLFASSLAAADDATAEMQRQHARELGELRQSLQAQTEALGRAVGQLKLQQQQQQQRQQDARDVLPPTAPRPQQQPHAQHVHWAQQQPIEPALLSPPPAVAEHPRVSITLPPKATPPPGPSRMSSLLAHASSGEDVAHSAHGDDDDGGGVSPRRAASVHDAQPPARGFPTGRPPPPPPPTPTPGYEVQPSLVAVAQLVIGGWTRHEAAAALAATHGRLDDARAWLEVRGSASRAAPPAVALRGVPPGTPTTRL